MEENQNNFGSQSVPENQPPSESTKAAFLYKRPVGPVTFGLIILMFFFSFIDIKCNNMSLAKIKGYQLATGYSLEKGSGEGDHKQHPNLFAAGALFLGLLGFGLAFVRSKPGSVMKIVCGFLGFMNMALLFISLKYDVAKSNRSSSSDNPFGGSIKISIDFQLAFWIALLLFIFGGVLGILELRKKKI